jgi:hypothetical protein
MVLFAVRVASAAALSGLIGIGSVGAQPITPLVTEPTPRYSAWGLVQELEAGWAQDTLAIWHAAPLVNPNACGIINAGYATEPSDPGHSLYHTLLLSAFLNRKEVALLISGCVFDKPRVIAVKLR